MKTFNPLPARMKYLALSICTLLLCACQESDKQPKPSKAEAIMERQPHQLVAGHKLDIISCPDIPDCELHTYQGKAFTGISTWGESDSEGFTAIQYLDGKRHGLTFSATRNHMDSSKTYRHGTQHGEAIYYRDESNMPSNREVWTDGKVTERWVYSPEGELYLYDRYENNNRVDAIQLEQGKPVKHEYNRDGAEFTRTNRYYESGWLRTEILEDKRYDTALYSIGYHDQGQREFTSQFDPVAKTHQVKEFSETGRLIQVKRYTLEPSYQKHGEWRRYDEATGKLNTQSLYQNGELISETKH